MITRIFRVEVPSALHAEFERKFLAVSVPHVQAAAGSVAVSVGRPTRWAPKEFVMISVWRDEAALRAFAGEHWNQAVIPAGMEKFVDACWVHHYEQFDSTELP